jgi:hypothetical protein
MMNTGERFYPDQRMSRVEALKSYTIKAAYAAFEEDIKAASPVSELAHPRHVVRHACGERYRAPVVRVHLLVIGDVLEGRFAEDQGGPGPWRACTAIWRISVEPAPITRFSSRTPTWFASAATSGSRQFPG